MFISVRNTEYVLRSLFNNHLTVESVDKNQKNIFGLTIQIGFNKIYYCFASCSFLAMSFELLKYYFRFMCLTPRSSRSDLIWNIMFVGDFAISFLSTLWFIVFVGRTLNEYSQSFHYMMCSLLSLSWYLTYCWQAGNFSRLFVTLDELIETSKLFKNAQKFYLTVQSIELDHLIETLKLSPISRKTGSDKAAYTKTMQRMEKLTRVVHLLMMKITVPFIVLSPTVVSIVKYLSTGQIIDSLHQIYPAT